MNNTDLILDLISELIQLKNAPQEFSEGKTIVAPSYMAAAAKRGLKIRENQPKSQRCCLAVGLRRAHQLANKEPLSLSTLKRMKSFLSRHGASVTDDIDKTSKLAQSINLWGAPATKAGIERTIGWLENAINKLN